MIMINNMFSIFDPSSSNISAGWAIIIVPLIVVKNSPNKKLEKDSAIIGSLTVFVEKELSQLIRKNLKITSIILLSLFTTLLIINFNAIFPFNFTPTAHISVRFTIRIRIWLSTIMFGWKNQFKNIITHLTPLGTPNALINFIVIIEIIRRIIRPITLSIRLSANMVAGHLLIALLSSFSLRSAKNITISAGPIVCLIALEMAVALVQAYVFITLLALYQNETS